MPASLPVPGAIRTSEPKAESFGFPELIALQPASLPGPAPWI
jgi:hypothetical protein